MKKGSNVNFVPAAKSSQGSGKGMAIIVDKVQMSVNKRSFQLNGMPFFYLADTVWSAFTNITLEDWEFYLDKRRKQGFNVLQINVFLNGIDVCRIAPFIPLKQRMVLHLISLYGKKNISIMLPLCVRWQWTMGFKWLWSYFG